MILQKVPFAFHAIIETAAALSFIITPEKQLSNCTPAAKLILRQYGGLLIATNLVCLAVFAQPTFESSGQILAVALGSYHIWPAYRAYARLKPGVVAGDVRLQDAGLLGGPMVHLIVHILSLGMFLAAALA
jgi:hypothetical protein